MTLTLRHRSFLGKLGAKLKKTVAGADLDDYLRRYEKTEEPIVELKAIEPSNGELGPLEARLQSVEDQLKAGGSVTKAYKELDSIKNGAKTLLAKAKERQAEAQRTEESIRRECDEEFGRVDALLLGIVKDGHHDPKVIKEIEKLIAKARAGGASAWDDLTNVRQAFNLATAERARLKAKALGLVGDQAIIDAEAAEDKAMAELPGEMVAWIKIRNRANQAIKNLREVAAAEAITIGKDLAAVEGGLGSAPDPAKLTAARKTADGIIAKCGKAEAKAAAALQAALAPLAASLARIERANEQFQKDTDIPEVNRKHAALRVKSAQAAAACTNLDAAKAALPILTEIEQSLGLADVARFKLIQTRVADAKTRLGSAVLAAQLKPTQTELQKEYDGLVKSLTSMSAAAGLQAIEAFVTRVQQQVAVAEAIVAWRANEYKTTCKDINGLFKELDGIIAKSQWTDDKKYAGPLVGEFANIKAAAERTGKDPRSPFNVSTTALRTKITTALSNEGGAVVNDHKNAVAALARQKDDLKTWTNNTYKAFTNALARVEKAVKDAKGDLSEIDSLRRLGKGADSIAKSFDFAAAQERLGFAYKQLYVLEKNPQGSKATAKNELPKMKEQWHSAVKELKKDLKKMAQKIADECVEAGVTPPPALESKLQEIADHFNAKVFDLHIELLTTNGTDPKTLKASREVALQYVRRYKDVIRNNPMVAAVVVNPFEGGVMTPLYNALKSLDLNLQRCL